MRVENDTPFDVFLSHNSLDKAVVEELAHLLERHGIKPWLDKWELLPGQLWLPAIRDGLSRSKIVAVCISENSIGPIQNIEAQAALLLHIRAEKRIVPLLLPGCPVDLRIENLDVFLGLHSLVDCREDLSAAIQALGSALPMDLSRTRDDVVLDCPFPGILPFRERETRYYFGRSDDVEDLKRRLQSGRRFIILTGASGSGKSSLLRAGIIPAVRSGELGSSFTWDAVYMRPGARPCHELAKTIEGIRGTESDLSTRTAELKRLRELLNQNSETLSDTVDIILGSRDDENRLVLIIDQFEELYSLCMDEAERQAFLDNLMTAIDARNKKISLIISVRPDFLSMCLDNWPNIRSTEPDIKTLYRMDGIQLRAAVELPAKRTGLVFDAHLIDDLIEEVLASSSELPLLQFALRRMWDKKDGARLTRKSYQDMGKLRGALTQHADSAVEELSEEERAATREVLISLVIVEGTAQVRARRPVTELTAGNERLKSVIDRLIAKRLLVVTNGEVEIVHDVLIREWSTLKTWLAENHERSLLLRELERAAEVWEKRGRPVEELWRGGRLIRAEEIFTQNALQLPLLSEFLSKSQEYIESQNKAARERRFRFMATISTILFIGLTLSLWLGIKEKKAKLEATRSAATSQVMAKAAQLSRVISDALREEAFGRYSQALALMRAAVALDSELSTGESKIPRKHIRSMGGHALIELERLTRRGTASKVLTGPRSSIEKVAFTADGKFVLASSIYKLIAWDAATGKIVHQKSRRDRSSFLLNNNGLYALVQPAKGIKETTLALFTQPWVAPVMQSQISRDGRPKWQGRFLLTDIPDRVTIFDSESLSELPTAILKREEPKTSGDKGSAQRGEFKFPIWVASQGEFLVSVRKGSTVVLERSTGQYIYTLRDREATSFAESLDGQHWALLYSDKKLQFVDAMHKRTTRIEEVPFSPGRPIAFSRDNKFIIGSTSAELHIINTDSGELVATHVVGEKEYLLTWSINPAGSMTAVGTTGARTEILGLPDLHRVAQLSDHLYSVNSLVFAPDGKLLATASADSTVRLWNIGGQRVVRRFAHPLPSTHDYSFSPKEPIVVVNTGKEIVILELQDGEIVHTLPLSSEDARYSKPLFSPDAMRIVTWRHTGFEINEMTTGTMLRNSEFSESRLIGLAWCPNSKCIATLQEDWTVTLWDVVTGASVLQHNISSQFGRPTNMLRVPHPFQTDPVFSSDGRWLAAHGPSGVIQVYDTETKTPSCQLDPVDAGQRYKRHERLAFIKNSPFLVGFDSLQWLSAWDVTRCVRLYDSRLGAELDPIVSADGTSVLLPIDRQSLALLDSKTGSKKDIIKIPGCRPSATALLPNSNRIAIGCEEGVLVLWSIPDRKILWRVENLPGPLSTVVPSPDGDRLLIQTARVDFVAGRWPRLAFLYDTISGELIEQLARHDVAVKMGFSPDGKIVVGEGYSGGPIEFLRVHPRRSTAELLELTGSQTNVRVCRETFEPVVVLPYPSPASIWAPKDLCKH